MFGISRLGDSTITGGKVIQGSPTVFANGRPVGLLFNLVTPHPPAPKEFRHTIGQVRVGSPNVFCNGLPVLRVGSLVSCGCTIITGSFNVFVP
jgi:uncharacterized Zn-binding protein involved in type VI secretion